MNKKFIALAAILYGGYLVYDHSQRPDFWEAEAEMQTQLNREHAVNSLQLHNESEKLVAKAERTRKVSTQADLHKKLMPSADRAAMLVDMGEAWKARAYRQVTLRLEPIVKGGQNLPISFFPAFEPILVVIPENDKICTGSRPNECASADGMYEDGYPEEHDNKLTVLQVPGKKYGGHEGAAPGNYHAHIARVCRMKDNCTEWVQTGFVYAVCGHGEEQQWQIGFVKIGGLQHNEDYFGGDGGFSFRTTIAPRRGKPATKIPVRRSCQRRSIRRSRCQH
jgi:hypothetical protein